MSQMNFDNLENIIESLVKESIMETYGQIFIPSSEEENIQDAISQ